jgi:hypothetical protein
MAEPAAMNSKQRDFPLARVSQLSSASSASPGIVRLTNDALQIHHDSHQIALDVNLQDIQVQFCNTAYKEFMKFIFFLFNEN